MNENETRLTVSHTHHYATCPNHTSNTNCIMYSAGSKQTHLLWSTSSSGHHLIVCAMKRKKRKSLAADSKGAVGHWLFTSKC